MSEREFHWFCKALRWSTFCTGLLIAAALILILFGFTKAPSELYLEASGIIILLFWFYDNNGCKKMFYDYKKVERGYYGATGIMYPLWQNFIFWFFYIALEFAAAFIVITGSIKAIFETP